MSTQLHEQRSKRTNEEMNFVLYDGDCNMCKASVEFLRKRDKYHRIQFMPLDSVNARKELKNVGVPFMQKNTVYFIHQQKAYIKSTAVLKALSLLHFPYSTLSYLQVFPLFIRDGVYNFIAKNRHKFY
jgi:predicted DCC family thiol-disulfide oxidoreductase YuxK